MFHWRRSSYFLLGLLLLFLVGGLGYWILNPASLEIILSPPGVPELEGYVYPLYELDLRLDGSGKKMTGNAIISYTNNQEGALGELYFHLYPNAALFTENVNPPGALTVDSVQVQGDEGALWEVHKTILKVKLSRPIPPGGKTGIQIPFSLSIPTGRERFGVQDGILGLGNCYPILAVYEGEWRRDPYYEIGDPFYSDIALYRVTINVPRRYTVAATGSLLASEKVLGFRKKLHFETGPVRDFALAASGHYQVLREEASDTVIQSFYPRGREESGRLALTAAKEALEFFQEKFGVYPYNQLSVAATGMFSGGMEYPNIVFIGSELYREGNESMLEYIVVHEVAHQWWYGLVGNDQIREPWLDEGLADFSTQVFYEFCRPGAGDIMVNSFAALYEQYRDTYGGGTIRRPLWEFESDLEYGVLVYGKGSLVFSQLRSIFGDEAFFRLLRDYAEKYRYRHATIDGFIEFSSDAAGKDLKMFFYKWLEAV